MIGLVLVAHSAEVVRGLRAMVAQAAPAVPVEGAGGLSEGRLGTSAPEVAAALRRALETTGGDAVLVFLDLGSAGMALEMALDELTPAERERVRVSAAPIVEGAVHASVAAAAGDDVDAVEAAAVRGGRAAKMPAD